MASQILLLDLPVEIIQNILCFATPSDVAAFSRTCHAAYALIYLAEDQHLWRQLYLASFDDPQDIASARLEVSLPSQSDSINWKRRLTELVRLEKLLEQPLETVEEQKISLEAAHSLIQNCYPAQTPSRGDIPSSSLRWLENLYAVDTRLLEDPIPRPSPDDDPEVSDTESEDDGELFQLRAQLRCCFSSTFRDQFEYYDEEKRTRSRNYVYNLRKYGPSTLYGPFLPNDGGVNWLHVEHLANVVWRNLCDLPRLGVAKPPVGMEAIRPYSAPGGYSEEDWAGIEGAWSRYVCFMDYRDLFAFNFTEGGSGANFFREPFFREATRLLQVQLRVVPLDQLKDLGKENSRLLNEIIQNSQRPPLFFVGTSRGSGTTEPILRGFVHMEKDGTIRWRFVRMSGFDESPQWSSAGVQVGHVASAMGVVGVWTTTTHERGDPVGPFWMWKNSLETPAEHPHWQNLQVD